MSGWDDLAVDEWDEAYDAYLEGRELHRRGRHRTEAEAAYRRALERGFNEAGFFLGTLLAGRRGRLAEEEAAYRVAMTGDDTEIAAHAALALGRLLDMLRGDLDGAQMCFEFARDHGTPDLRRLALVNLSMLLAYREDGEAAARALNSYLSSRHPADDGVDYHQEVADAISASASGGRGRGAWRVIRRINYRGSRRRRALRSALVGDPRL